MRHANNYRSVRAAFTLVEMLVVIGIVAVLFTVIGVVVSRAKGSANKFQLAAQLQTIAVALDAYKADFASYPATTPENGIANDGDDRINAEGFRGARLLCKALMGACPQGVVTSSTFDLSRADQDGADGLGFRVPPRSGVFQFATTTTLAGKVYGPYLAADKFRITDVATIDNDMIDGVTYKRGEFASTKTYSDRAILLDGNGNPILFYPCLNPQAPIGNNGALAGSYISRGRRDTTAAGAVEAFTQSYGGTAMYAATDNGALLDAPTFRSLMGDTGNSNDPNQAGWRDGIIDSSIGEKPATRGKYILWSAGPDGKFGSRNKDGSAAGIDAALSAKQQADEVRAARSAGRFDDVTNFDLD